MEKHCPDLAHLVPNPDGIDLKKLQEALFTSDTCSTAQKERRVFIERIGGIAYQQDCHNHLRCVHTNGMEKALCARLQVILKDSLEEIDPKLRVSCVYSAYCRAYDKFFSLCCNYAKGKGENFAIYLREYHPGIRLFHIESAQGSRQDLSLMASPAIYMNRVVCLEYADHLLRMHKVRDNILLRNLFVLMTSSEMVAMSRLMSIFFLAFGLPLRFLAGKTKDMKEWNWGPVSMSRALDTFREKLMELKATPREILKEDFMMEWFSDYRHELPPVEEYYQKLYHVDNEVSIIARQSKSKVLSYSDLRQALFYPDDETNRWSSATNKATDDRVVELAEVAAIALLDELHNEAKATWKYLSVSGSEYSWAHCPVEVKAALLGLAATNDYCESALGGVTQVMKNGGRVNIAGAAAQSDTSRNGYLDRTSKKKKYKTKGGKKIEKKEGLFHSLNEKLRDAIIQVAIEDAPEARSENNAALEKQRQARLKKEEILKQKGLDKATGELADSICYYSRYHSDACIKDVKEVTKLLKKHNQDKITNTGMEQILKENIRMRTKGCGWGKGSTPDFHISWSQDNTKRPLQELAAHLKKIIKLEKSMTFRQNPR